MSEATGALGTTLARDGNVISELTKIGSPKYKMDTIDVTNHQSTDGFKEFIGGLLEAGELPLEGNFIPGDTNGQVGLVTDMMAKTKQNFVLTFPNSVTFTFAALVTAFELGDADVSGALTFKAALKISGKPALGITVAANLTDLVVTTGTLVPAFAGATKEYVVNIATDQTTVTVTPTCAAANSIEVDDNVVATGQPSSPITLGAAGSVKTITVVTKQAGKSDNIYTLYLTRA